MHKLDHDGNGKISFEEMVKFEKNRLKGSNVLAIAIYWIGHVLDPSCENDFLEENGLLFEAEGEDHSKLYPQYELTV